MILKIGDGAKGWVWFDEVTSPHFLSSETRTVDRDEARDITYDNQPVKNLISKECFDREDTIVIGLIKFRSNNREYVVVFTGVTYICDNNGDTIEKIDLNKGR